MKVLLATLVVSVGALAQIPVPPGTEKETAMARALAEEIERRNPLLNDPQTAEYLNGLVERITRVCASRTPIAVKVFASDEVDATVSFGGYVYFTSGFLRRSENEAAVAGVLAHLLAFNDYGFQPLRYLPNGPLVFFGGLNGYSFLRGIGLGPLEVQRRARESMLEADARAIGCIHDVGYDPESFIGALSKSNHPERLERAQAAKAELKPKSQYIVDRAEFAAVRERLLPVGAAARDTRKPPSLRYPGRR
jgi:hypothetical protein